MEDNFKDRKQALMEALTSQVDFSARMQARIQACTTIEELDKLKAEWLNENNDGGGGPPNS